jgi:ABC-type glycerol-3-phosphate transport system substrate-binding protein
MQTNVGRRGFLTALGLAGLASVLAACGAAAPTAAPPKPTEAPKPAAAAPPAQPAAPTTAPAAGAAPAAAKPAAGTQQVNIVIHFSAGGRYAEFVNKYSQDVVAKKLPNVKIEVLEEPGGVESFTKMLALFAAGRSGDMGYIFPAQGWLGSFSAKGMFADHDALVKADNYDLKQFFDNAIKFSRVDGVLRAMPWHAHAEHWTWFLNLNAFEEAGVKVPPQEPPYEWKIEDEVDMLSKVVKKNGDKVERYGMINNVDSISVFMIARAFGGDLISEDGKSARIGEKPARDAIKWMHDRVYKHKYAPTASQMEGNLVQMFIAGKVAALSHAGSVGLTMRKSIGDSFKMGVVAGPNGPAPTGQKAAGVGPNCLGLLTSSKNKDQAWQVLKEHVSKEAGVEKVFFGAGAPGGRPDSYDDPRLIGEFPGVKVIRYQLGFGWQEHLPWNLRGREMTAAIQNTLDNVWLNKMTPDEGVDATIKAMDEVFKLPDVRTEKA